MFDVIYSDDIYPFDFHINREEEEENEMIPCPDCVMCLYGDDGNQLITDSSGCQKKIALCREK